jgi:hypothetical protein
MHRKFLISLLLLLASALGIPADANQQPRALTDKEVRALVLALDDPLVCLVQREPSCFCELWPRRPSSSQTVLARGLKRFIRQNTRLAACEARGP